MTATLSTTITVPFPEIHGFVQAGGRSTRMGTDKAWVEIAGRPLLGRVLDAVRPIAARRTIIISADNPNAGRYQTTASDYDANVSYDLHNHLGPLGGIHTALKSCDANETALILACDLPYLTTEFLAFLCQKHLAGKAQITVPCDQTGRWQPLVALYETSCLPLIETQLATGQLKVDRLFAHAQVQKLAFSDFATLAQATQLFINVNQATGLAQLTQNE